MTTVPNPSKPKFESRIAAEKDNRLDRWLDTASGWFSPLLVKETRQALKSRQFVLTFFLLMVIVVSCLIIGVTLTNDIGSVSFSVAMLATFLIILGFPLFIIIPFTAFRSLASEFEDGTLQLVSITSMKPYQIIIGKFGSAALQMMIYLAVLAPCIAFTYLLRGLDIRVIMYCLLLCTVSSICLTSIGLFAGSITNSRATGAGLAVLLLLLLGFAYFFWIIFSSAGANELPSMLAQGGKIALDAFFGITLTTSILAFAGASAMLTFHADNRATKLRVAMLLQQTVFLGWTAAMLTCNSRTEVWFSLNIIACHYWMLMGAMMTFVPAGMSHRVRRSLPKTALTQSLFSLFLPGPGRGYLYAVSNLFACSMMFVILAMFAKQLLPNSAPEGFSFGQTISGFSYSDMQSVLLFVFGNFIYAMFFLTIVFFLGRLINRTTRRIFPVAGLILLVIVMFAMIMIGLVLQYNFSRTMSYSLLQTFNWYWTMLEIGTSNFDFFDFFNFRTKELGALAIMTLITTVMSIFAFFIASRDFKETAVAVPDRVLEDKKKVEVEELPKGETIDDILGILPEPPKDEQ